MKTIKIYMAARIFNQAELYHIGEFTAMLKDYAEQKNELSIKFFIPCMDSEEKDLISKYSHQMDVLYSKIAEEDYAQLDSSDITIALCDGVDVDSGVAVEVAHELSKNKPVITVITDFRYPNMLINPMFYHPKDKDNKHTVAVSTLDIMEKAFEGWKINKAEGYSVTDNPDFNVENYNKRIKSAYTSLVISKVYDTIVKIFI